MSRVKFDEINKVWTSDNGPLLYNSNISLSHILLKSMLLHGSKIAQVIEISINFHLD